MVELTTIDPICDEMLTMRGRRERRSAGNSPRARSIGPSGVDPHLAHEVLGRELEDVAFVGGRAQTLGREAGVVDEHVDRVAAVHGRDEVGDRTLVAGVDGMDVLGDGPQLVGAVRCPATTDDRVAASREGLGQLETEAPVGAGDHDRVDHVVPPSRR